MLYTCKQEPKAKQKYIRNHIENIRLLFLEFRVEICIFHVDEVNRCLLAEFSQNKGI